MTTRKTKTVPTYICDNPRFYCLEKYSNKPHRCPICGGNVHQIGTPEGGRLKVLREKKRGTLSGSIRNIKTGVKASKAKDNFAESDFAIKL